MPQFNKAEREMMERLGIEVSEPPERVITRRSKFAEHYTAIMQLTHKIPGQWLKMAEWPAASQPYNLAAAINNNERREFQVDSDKDGGEYEAYATKIGSHVDQETEELIPDMWGIWIRWVTPEVKEFEAAQADESE